MFTDMQLVQAVLVQYVPSCANLPQLTTLPLSQDVFEMLTAGSHDCQA